MELQNTVKLRDSRICQLNPDCIKKCHLQDSLFAVGHYRQIEGENVEGAISIIDINNFPENVSVLKTSPVLHLVWLTRLHNDRYVILAACRDSTIKILSFRDQLKEIKSHKIEQPLYNLYCDATWLGQTLHVVVSTSHKSVYYLELDTNFDIKLMKKQTDHEYSVWTCRLNPQKPHIFLSGDQMGTLNMYDMSLEQPLVCKNSKIHQSGISDIVIDNQCIYTCTFGGEFRQLSQNLKTMKQTKTTGVIWRAIVDKSQILLCISSDNKYEVISRDTFDKKYEISGHKSLAYAGDWNVAYILTASFYDKLMCLWNRV